jgi:exopolyphosphatase/guanosine-5'-triphosphate,3'-diphosphate pyrophosphatase
MVLDIGGGSTELAALVDGELQAFSMQLGCVRVTERALGAAIVTPEREMAARAMIASELDRAWANVTAFEELRSNVRLVGVAGTVATLAQLVTGEATYVREAVHHQILDITDVVTWRQRLGAMSPSDRLEQPGMVPGREDVLVAGLLILELVLERFSVSTFITSEDDILDGVADAVRRNEMSNE